MSTHFMRRGGVSASLRGLAGPLVMVLWLLAALAWSPGVQAHASLLASDPAAGAVLAVAPERIRLTFNEPVSPLLAKIVQPDGSMQDLAGIRVLPQGLEVTLPDLLQQGTYGLSWRVVSADGHPVGGTLAFSIGNQSAAATPGSSSHGGRAFLIWLFRLAGYAGLFFSIGMAVWRAPAPPDLGARRPALWLTLMGTAAILSSVGLQGIDALDRPLSGLLSISTWRAGAASPFGLSALLALLSLACAAATWTRVASFPRRLLAAMAVILLGASLAASGHAGTAPPAWLSRPAVWLHAAAVALWIGALPPLARALGTTTDPGLLQAFSRWIPMILLILLASGAALIFVQFDTPSSLWRTAYGQVLALKLALVAVLLALGAYNRYRLSPAALREEPAPRRTLRRIIRVECTLALVVLGVVALWRFTPPPRALDAAPQMILYSHIHTPTALADLSMSSPAPGGPAKLTISLADGAFMPLAAQEVNVTFFNVRAGVEPLSFAALQDEDGTWKVEDIKLPRLDNWSVRIEALISDFDRISLETTLDMEGKE